MEHIILDVQANQWRDSFSLADLAINGQPATYHIELNRLQVDLAEPLASGCWLEIRLRFQLRADEIRDGLRSYRGFFGYSPRQLNLGHALPTVAARLGGGWRIHAPAGIGEQIVNAVADWEVDLAVDNAEESLQLAAPGVVTATGDQAWSIRLPQSRDFALSLSEEFIVTEQQLADGRTLAVFSFADAQVNDRGLVMDGAAHTLQESVKALQLFERRFGRYPYNRLVVVQGDFPDGMEFTGLVFVGSAWFYGFDGTEKNYLTLITIHEIAHQWWYARVGNDAALNPWLDEALATYSEYLYIEEYYPGEKNWWWYFRVAAYLPKGGVDSAVYEFNTPREYINAVYLRGAQMLQNLREDIGDESFFQLLRSYYVAGDSLIADSALFWRQLAPDQQALTAATRNEFLTDPAVFAVPAEKRVGSGFHAGLRTHGMANLSVDSQITFLYTDDLARAAEFYEGALGLKLALDQGGCRIYRVSDGRAYIGVCQAAQAPVEPASIIFTLVTPDVDGWYERISGQGWECEHAAALQRGL